MQQVIVKVWRSQSVEDLVKIPPNVHFALDLDQWEFAIKGNVPQHHGECISIGMSSLDTGRRETLTGTFFGALRVRPTPGEDTPYCPCGNIKGLTNGYSFHTHQLSPHCTSSLNLVRPYHSCQEQILPVKLNRRSKFMGHCFVTTGSITMKLRNWVEVSISWCKHFQKNIRSFIEIYKSLKTIITVSHLKRGTLSVKHLTPFFV